MSRPTGRNDPKPLPRADDLRQIPRLCPLPAPAPCSLTMISALQASKWYNILEMRKLQGYRI